MAYRTFQLSIMAGFNVGGGIIDDYIRIQLSVFKRFAVDREVCDLRNTEYKTWIYLGLPPNGSHGAGDRSANYITNAKRLEYIRST